MLTLHPDGPKRLARLLLWPLLLGVLASCNTSPDPPALRSALTAYADEPFSVLVVDRSKFPPEFQPVRVANTTGLASGSILVDTAARLLYLVETPDTALRYGVAVGASGHAWSGEAVVGRKAEWPSWYPTDDMHAETPGLPREIPPGPQNPLGARALYLHADGRDTLYRIHGTSEPWTIGTEASSGCIRMLNEDVIALFDRVEVGAQVVVW